VAYPDAVASAKALYESYTQWCEENGERAQPQRSFGRQLSDRGFTRFRGTANRNMWKGISLKTDSSPDESYPSEDSDFPRPNRKNERQSYPSYPKNRLSASELSFVELTGNQGNLGNSDDPIANPALPNSCRTCGLPLLTPESLAAGSCRRCSTDLAVKSTWISRPGSSGSDCGKDGGHDRVARSQVERALVREKEVNG
jgi:hypothetical protein